MKCYVVSFNEQAVAYLTESYQIPSYAININKSLIKKINS